MRYKLNTAEVYAEVFDGEAVVMNLGEGLYFSFNAVGSEVWVAVCAGASIEEIARGLEARYAVPSPQAVVDVTDLVERLVERRLILPEPARSVAAFPAAIAGQSYEAPALRVHNDMRDLLALDPPAPSFGSARQRP